MGDHRPFVGEGFEQVPRFVRGAQRARGIDHLGVRERRTCAVADAPHSRVGETGHGGEQQRRLRGECADS